MAAGHVNGGARARTLADTRAKSKPWEDPERLTTHSRIVHDTVAEIEGRVARAGVLATAPSFWDWVRRSAILHDTGKVAEGFQRQLPPGGPPWGERHEVLSLAYVDLAAEAAGWSDADRLMIGTLVATHHRSLHSASGHANGKPSLSQLYNAHTRWDEAFTLTPGPQGPQVQVPRSLHRELLAWLAGAFAMDPPPQAPGAPTLAERAGRFLHHLLDTWREPVKPDHGLLAVLAQGALTLADHAGSAHVPLQTHMPLDADYFARLPYPPYPHQRQAAATEGHLILMAPTGSGKTESGLAWAARQLATMPGRPRLVWTLPYRASLNAARLRLQRDLVPAPGDKAADIGLLHGTVAHALLTQAVDDDCGPEQGEPTAAQAKQARARAAAMRLFTQRLRVATPHQLLRAAIAGPAYSSVLLEQANSLFVLDELHAYEPETFGRLCAAMALWERLGSRVAVLSATLAPPMTTLIDESLTQPVTSYRAPPGTSPVRHRLVLDDEPLDSPVSLGRIRDRLAEGHSVLVVANRVATAQRVHAELADDARKSRPDDPHAALLLHSRFKYRDRDAIEKNLLRRHPERRPGETDRRGGLVVATQAVEVSLQLDFDRAAVECAPVEAVAQRAGRVNRRGRHPEGPVEFRVHRATTDRPYDQGAMAAAWHALTDLVADGVDTLSEEDIDRLLAAAYDSPWGTEWAEAARRARNEFATSFLTFTDPFQDRGEFADRLNEQFDSVDVLHHENTDEYRSRTTGKRGDPLLATGLLIPLPYRQLKTYDATWDRTLRVHVIHQGTYAPDTGLTPPDADPETVL
ncbi:CRISPR-associated helicase Cas3' [Streptomyces radicis]|uniref:CRISPR-associated helicase Cas3 n=1 Tax=Streptomyces radicis TaxID=1750517 RepID=A0A3A9WFL8_9ACTN|nr:CRISPR-associated helicase Cas3' [Streptomyces radicis]RKN11580.1 CRISPR-associated helicase Cas3' [Streptomyces radicis]RKN26402.1 CRISPR-associated helicase Cas3' [Streptomyces radicis]